MASRPVGTIETADGGSLREVDVASLEDMEIPLTAFTIHVNVGPAKAERPSPRRLALLPDIIVSPAR